MDPKSSAFLKGLRTAAVCVAILIAVGVPLKLHRWVATDSFPVALFPSAESVLVLWVIAVTCGLPAWGRRIVLGPVSLFVALLAIFSGAEALFQFIYARPFSPQADIPMVRGGLLLLFGEIGALADVLTPSVVSAIIAVVWSAALALVAAASSALRRWAPAMPRRVLFPAVLVPLLMALLTPQLLSATVIRSLSGDGSAEFVDVMEGDASGIADSAVGDKGDYHATYAFPGLRDRDIFVFAIEAYGYAAFSRDQLYRQLEPTFERFLAVLREHGYGIKTNYLRSPVAGGFSWLAEATLLTGQWINSQPRFEQLYENPVSSLPGMLHDGGYYTFTVRPGTVHGEWPEGWDLFRFEDAMIAYDGDFDYRGPGFSYVPITDQVAIWQAHRRLSRSRAPDGPAHDRPLFAYYQLVSSHTPFNRIPPFVEEWEQLGDGSIYQRRSDEILKFNNTWGGGTELDEGFVASISYVFTVLSDYIDRYLDHDRDPIVIVFGDHQPQRPIREQNAHLSVPVHIASRDPEVLRLFAGHGFTPGIRGTQSPPHRRMSEFFPMFAEVAHSDLRAERLPGGTETPVAAQSRVEQ